MKDEKVWDFSHCQIGAPCAQCIKTCTYLQSREIDQDEKENKNERITEEDERTIQPDFYRKWRNDLFKHAK